MSEHMDGMSQHDDLLPLRSPEEAPAAFELVRRGYDRDQVDNHLGWLEDQLRNAEIARDAAEHAAASAAAEAEAAREELESGRPQWHEFGDRITEILNLADRSTEKGIMEGLEAEDPDLVEQIRRLMFVFEDILLVNDKGIQAVLKEVENDELSLALKTASQELKDKIFKNMSERAAKLIAEDMQYMGPVRVSDVEAAQQKIVDIVRRLEDAGEIIIAGRGGEKEMVV